MLGGPGKPQDQMPRSHGETKLNLSPMFVSYTYVDIDLHIATGVDTEMQMDIGTGVCTDPDRDTGADMDTYRSRYRCTYTYVSWLSWLSVSLVSLIRYGMVLSLP